MNLRDINKAEHERRLAEFREEIAGHKLDPRKEGTFAYQKGELVTACPYQTETDEFKKWISGYNEAELIDEELKKPDEETDYEEEEEEEEE